MIPIYCVIAGLVLVAGVIYFLVRASENRAVDKTRNEAMEAAAKRMQEYEKIMSKPGVDDPLDRMRELAKK